MKNAIRTDFIIGLIELRRFVRNELPVLNQLISEQKYCPVQFSKTCSVYVEKVLNLAKNNIYFGRNSFYVLQPLTFIVSSIERHLQTLKIPKRAFDFLPSGVENFMVELARNTGIPPRDNVYTTWLWNKNFRFDNSRGWATFKKGVMVYNDSCHESNELLRKISVGEISLDDKTAVDVFNTVTNLINNIFDTWKKFMEKENDAYKNISPNYFMYIYRTYFLPYKVAGETWSGTNAANVAAGMSLDLLLGCYEPFYIEIIYSRLKFLSPADRELLLNDVKRVNIVEHFARKLGLAYQDLKDKPVEILKTQIQYPLNPDLVSAFITYFQAVDKWSGLSRMHKGMISTYLEKPSKQMMEHGCPAGYDAPAVNPEAGTGGMNHDTTRLIMEMRWKNKEILKLKELFN